MPGFIKKLNNRKIFFALICIAIVFSGSSVFAHRVTVFAWVEGDTVYTESKFSAGRKAKGATIEVYDEKDNKLLTGKTDDQGNFSFKIPKKTTLKIVLIAGMGHKNHWIIEKQDIDDSIADETDNKISKQDSEKSLQVSGQIEDSEKVFNENSDAQIKDIRASEIVTQIQIAIEKALDKKIDPLIRKISRIEQENNRIKPTDVLGGIGYILGLVGIVAYFKSKKTRNRNV